MPNMPAGIAGRKREIVPGLEDEYLTSTSNSMLGPCSQTFLPPAADSELSTSPDVGYAGLPHSFPKSSKAPRPVGRGNASLHEGPSTELIHARALPAPTVRVWEPSPKQGTPILGQRGWVQYNVRHP
ncbi:hypothetical protein LTR17_020269 [Elasticomyces elasticus]|nr:hypothetical protein LTR17_020269 [Elasticomyces elasticus]